MKKNKFFILLGIFLTGSFSMGLVYLVGQQILRLSANDPQVQMAEDAVNDLNVGASVASVIPARKVDMRNSLAPFVIVYNNAQKPIASSGLLSGKIPSPPQGVLDNVLRDGEERLTWQPESDVRIATVIIKYSNGFVLVGRSLREVEEREKWLLIRVAIVWSVFLLAVVLLAFLLGSF